MTSIPILVVEDSEELAELYLTMLRKWNFNPMLANRAADALQKIYNNHFDVILVDLILPDKSGLELCRELRKQGYAGKMIAMSGNGDNDTVQNAAAAGFDLFFSKMDPLNSLVHNLQKLLKPKP